MNIFKIVLGALSLGLMAPALSGCATMGSTITDPTALAKAEDKALIAIVASKAEADRAIITMVNVGVLTPGSAKSVAIADGLQKVQDAIDRAIAIKNGTATGSILTETAAAEQLLTGVIKTMTTEGK